MPTEAASPQEIAGVYARNVATAPPAANATFTEADPLSVVDGVNAEAFFDAAYEPMLARMIAHVVEIEGPVLDAALARRIARVHGWQRTGSRIRERVEALAAKAFKTTEEEVGTFYWPTGQNPDGPIMFRRAAGDVGRSVDEICMGELVALAKKVVATGLTGENAIASMARAVGLHQIRVASRGRLKKGMQIALGSS